VTKRIDRRYGERQGRKQCLAKIATSIKTKKSEKETNEKFQN
jgi:hypothetical protein